MARTPDNLEVFRFDSETGLDVTLVKDDSGVQLHAQADIADRDEPAAVIIFKSFDDVYAVFDAIWKVLNEPTWLPAGIGGANLAQGGLPAPKKRPTGKRQPVKKSGVVDTNMLVRVDELGLPIKTLGVINRQLGRRAILAKDLARFSAMDLMKLSRFGKGSLNDVRKALKTYNLRLRGDTWDG